MITQYIQMDQCGGPADRYLYEEMIEKYHLQGKPFVEVNFRQVCHKHAPIISSKVEPDYITDDVLIEVICDNRLIGLEYRRRDEFNYTEITKIDIKDEIK